MDHGLSDGEVAGWPLDRQAIDELFSRTYEELRRLATAVRRGDHAATINPTALVNEAWVKLAASPPAAIDSVLHFKRIAARAMRQVLVEAARRRTSEKRGAGSLAVTLDERVDAPREVAHEVVALDAALEQLAQLAPRQAAIVESRFFGGLTPPELERLFGLSEATVLREWRTAKAWLAARLTERR